MKFYVVNKVNDRNQVVYRVYTNCRHFDLPDNYGIYIYIIIYIIYIDIILSL